MLLNTRADLAKYFNELGFKTGAEIGVDGGAYSAILCEVNPGVKLYCIDMWELNAGGNRKMRLRKYAEAKEALAPYNATLIKKYSMDAVKDFKDNSLDFVYIDAGHKFDDVMQDIIGWAKKVRRGGIVSGHDYPTIGITTAVNAYVKCHTLRLQLTLDPSELISWYFVKKWKA